MDKKQEMSIADERRLEELNDRFRVKEAHERDITPLTSIVYFTMHIGSFAAALYGISQMKFDSNLEKLAYLVFFGLIMGLNEVFKAKKMEDFAVCKIISNDPKQSKEIRKEADKNTPKSFLFVLGFWLVSICVIGFTGYQFGVSKTNYQFTAVNYDESLIQKADNAISAVKKGIAEGYSAKKIQQLTVDQNAAIKEMNDNKKAVNEINKKSKNENEDEGVMMGLLYIVIAIGYEFILYLARMWHEKEQYAVLISKNKAKQEQETAEKQAKKDGNSKETGKKQRETEEITIKQKDLDSILNELTSLRTQKSLLEEVVNSKK